MGTADAIGDPFRFVIQRTTPKMTMIATTIARITKATIGGDGGGFGPGPTTRSKFAE